MDAVDGRSCRGAHDGQPRHRRPAVRIEHRRKDAVASVDCRPGREDEVEVRGPVAEHDQVGAEAARTSVELDDGAAHPAPPEDVSQRRGRDGPDRSGAGRDEDRPRLLEIGRVADEEGPLAGQDPMDRDEPMDEAGAHDAGAIRAADRRQPLV